MLVASVYAQGAGSSVSMSEMALPGGLKAAQQAAGDDAAPDPAHFLADLIRRSYDSPILHPEDPRAVRLRTVQDALRLGRAVPSSDSLPLPLTPAIWSETVFRGRVTPVALAGAILDSREASLLYYGLLSLDDDTRGWVAGQRPLIAELAVKYPGAFVVAAPALRISSSVLQLPGGSAAEPVWQALAGKRMSDPAGFVRALLGVDEGRLAAFAGAVAQLTPRQVQLAFSLDSADVSSRVDRGRRLYQAFRAMTPAVPIERRTFTRPPFDPLLMLAELDAGRPAAPLVPGTRGLWSAAFENLRAGGLGSGADHVGHPEWKQPADVVWLAEQVFEAPEIEHRPRYMMVLFAARHWPAQMAPDADRDAIHAIRAAAIFPALTAALERAGIDDFRVYAQAARRAAAISAIGDSDRQARALAQFQGAIALVMRAATRRSLSAQAASDLVSSLAAIPLGKDNEYDGAVARWLFEWLKTPAMPVEPAAAAGPAAGDDRFHSASGPLEALALQLLAGPPSAPRLIDWEGMSYRVDFARAEALRLAAAWTEAPYPCLSSAAELVRLSDALSGTMDSATFRQQAGDVISASRAAAPQAVDPALQKRHESVIQSLDRAARKGDVKAASRLVPPLRRMADDLVAQGLMELAYASALGARDGVALTAPDAVARHDFGIRARPGPPAAWNPPIPGPDFSGRWRVKGALLGLDVALAEFRLVRTSTRPPPRRPTLSDADRHVFVEAVALVEPSSLTDRDRDTLVAAMSRGRTRLSEARTPEGVAAVADAAGLSSLERTLASWSFARAPQRVPLSLSPSQLLWLGLEHATVDGLDAWGTPAGSRTGCACLRFAAPQVWERVAGRVNSGMTASAFPDLNLRLAELLAELHMPAALLGPVLTSATLDFIDTAVSRDNDDRRGLAEFVAGLRAENVEQYLALLTTGGALAPVEPSPGKAGPR